MNVERNASGGSSEEQKNGICEPFDPLEDMWRGDLHLQIAKNNVNNILLSYQDPYDILREPTQNAADSIEGRMRRFRIEGSDNYRAYQPEIDVIVDQKRNELRVVDNGDGISLKDAPRLFIPTYTNKHNAKEMIGRRLRGYKGVGLSFLSFNYNYIRISSKGPDGFFSYEFEGGRKWADSPEYLPLPKAIPSKEDCEIFDKLTSGTAVTIRLDESSNPRSLSRLGNSLRKWELLLRTKTALGFIDIRDVETWHKKVKIRITLIEQNGKQKSKTIPFRFFFPHEVTNFNFLDLKEFFRENPECSDPPRKYREKDAIFRSWSSEELFDPKSGVIVADDSPLLAERDAAVYAFAAHSSLLFEALSKASVKDERMRPVRAGAWIATMNAVEGRPINLEPRFDASSRERLFMLVEIDDALSDLGRKGFDPSLEQEVRDLGLAIIKYFNRHRRMFMKSQEIEIGQSARLITLDSLKKQAERRKKDSALSCGTSFSVEPANEPEVIALFNELIGRKVLLGYEQLGCYHNGIYDAIFHYELSSTQPKAVYDANGSVLGVPSTAFNNHKIIYPASCLEFKVNLDSLIRDINSLECSKRFEDLSLVVVWQKGRLFKEDYDLDDLTRKPFPAGRELHGTTHILQRKGVNLGHHIHIIELKTVLDLIRKGSVKLGRR